MDFSETRSSGEGRRQFYILRPAEASVGERAAGVRLKDRPITQE
jgi:hypothetical protein